MKKENIKNNTYPYTSNVYTAVRSDIDKSSLAYRIFDFLTTEEGQAIVDESGYVPMYSTPTEIHAIEHKCSQGDTIHDLSGRSVEKPGKGIFIRGGRKVAVK